MTGFEINPDELQKAITKLEEARDIARDRARDAAMMIPGELSAGDQATTKAREKFTKLATDQEGSLQKSAKDVFNKLDEKIEAYRQTLEEYRRSEDAANMDAGNIERQQ